MKKQTVLIITSARSDKSIDWKQREQYVRDFYASVEDRLKDTSILYTTYDDISCLVINNKLTFKDNRHDIDLKSVNLVHFKNWMFDFEFASLIAFYLRKNYISYFNEEVDAGLAWGKISQICRLALEGLPVSDTIFLKRKLLLNALKKGNLPESFTFPLIMKADDGAKGSNNYLVKSTKEAVDILSKTDDSKQFVLQQYHPNDGDFRYLFIGTDTDPIIFHRKSVDNNHLNNTSVGGSGTAVNVQSVPVKHLEIARKAAKCLKREISGVDIIVDNTTGKPIVLEVNSTPALATGFDVPSKSKHFAEFIKNNLELTEEE